MAKPNDDSQLRFWIIGALFTILSTVGSCSYAQFSSRLTTLEASDKQNTVGQAVTKKDLDDFHESTDKAFERLEKLIQADIDRHR